MLMPYGGNDWLALTQEPTLEPELPICDPHHHFWDRRLQSLPYQRYLLDELHADISSGHNVRSTVFLVARSMYRPDSPVAMRPVGEVEFVQGLAAASASGIYGPSRAATAIIGHADLKLGAHVAPVLDALQAASPNRFRGIRHNVTWSPDPAVDNRESEGILAHATFREGAQVLSQKGWSLDVMIAFPQMPEVADFARAVPDVPIILNHIGRRLSGEGVELFGRSEVFVSLLDHQLPFLDHVHKFDTNQRILGGRKRLEAKHGTGDALDCSMILFHDIIEIL